MFTNHIEHANAHDKSLSLPWTNFQAHPDAFTQSWPAGISAKIPAEMEAKDLLGLISHIQNCQTLAKADPTKQFAFYPADETTKLLVSNVITGATTSESDSTSTTDTTSATPSRTTVYDIVTPPSEHDSDSDDSLNPTPPPLLEDESPENEYVDYHIRL